MQQPHFWAHTQRKQNHYLKKTPVPRKDTMFLAALTTAANIRAQPKRLGHGNCGVHVYQMGYYSALHKKELLPSAALWMHLENIMLIEISKTQKDKYCMNPKNVKSGKHSRMTVVKGRQSRDGEMLVKEPKLQLQDE